MSGSPRASAIELSVIVPVRNEQDNILPLLGEIHAALGERLEFEVVYVDGGSSDGTANILREAMGRYPRLRVISHRLSCGQSAALFTGLRAARTAVGRPANLQLLTGYRRSRQDSRTKRISSRIANGVRSRLLGDAKLDTGCGLKLILRSTAPDAAP